MVRVDYWGSYFTNDIQTLTWDNPIRATDFNNGLLPPDGPYDPSGYSNGNGPALGQEALWPSNNLNSSAPRGCTSSPRGPRSTATCTLHVHAPERGAAAVDDQYRRSTTRPSSTRSRDSANCRGRRPRRRWTARTALLNFNSRELRFVTIQATVSLQRARQQDAAFRRPRIRPLRRSPRGVHRRSGHCSPRGLLGVRRRSRGRTSTSTARSRSRRWARSRRLRQREATSVKAAASATSARTRSALAYDARLFSYISVRAALDTGTAPRRRLHPVRASIRGGPVPARSRACAISTKPTAIAPRACWSWAPIRFDQVGVFFQFTTTRDTFLGDSFDPGGPRAVRPAERTTSMPGPSGLDYQPRTTWCTSALTYGWDKFNAVQKSRNANPPPDPTWTDPSRNWSWTTRKRSTP